jgi:hypothetical protein
MSGEWTEDDLILIVVIMLTAITVVLSFASLGVPMPGLS